MPAWRKIRVARSDCGVGIDLSDATYGLAPVCGHFLQAHVHILPMRYHIATLSADAASPSLV
jgi:hypothetical protein